MTINLSSLTTEKINERTVNIDQLSELEIIKLINNEDHKVAAAVEKVLPEIAKVIEVITASLKLGGRLFYVGAGTSGRIGILDAAECPPTFHTPPELVQALIAGGERAIYQAVEGAEDSLELGGEDLENRGLTSKDVVVGIAASGRTPYVIGALKYASAIGASTVSLACNKNAVISQYAAHQIEVEVGPEVLTGSTRMKAATAQKMVCNMLTTASMIRLGKVYENLMVDLNASNLKLVERAKYMLMNITACSYEEAEKVLQLTNFRVKPAVVMILTNSTFEEALELIDQAGGFVRGALTIAKGSEVQNEGKSTEFSSEPS